MKLSLWYQKVVIKITEKVISFLLPSPLQHYLQEDSAYFYDNYKDPDFDDTLYRKKLNPYFLKYGIKEPLVESEYYSRTSGIRSYRYMSRGLAFKLVYSYLERVEFLPAYSDKNIQSRVLSLGTLGKNLDIDMPSNIIYNMNGCFFNANDEEITNEEALHTLMEAQCDMILKPAIGSCGGKNVVKIESGHNDEQAFRHLFATYRTDFVFQHVVRQHPTLALFNPTSVNTIRIVTYRDPRKKRKVVYALIRFGGAGSIMDNICSGGGFCIIDVETGKLKDRMKHCYPRMRAEKIPDSFPNEIPCFDKIKYAVLTLHSKLPHFDVIGWDVTVDPEEHLVLVEYNVRPGHGLQQGVGPLFSDEDYDEIMENASNVRQGYRINAVLKFPGKPGFFFK